jgi:hypothetical protein
VSNLARFAVDAQRLGRELRAAARNFSNKREILAEVVAALREGFGELPPVARDVQPKRSRDAASKRAVKPKKGIARNAG